MVSEFNQWDLRWFDHDWIMICLWISPMITTVKNHGGFTGDSVSRQRNGGHMFSVLVNNGQLILGKTKRFEATHDGSVCMYAMIMVCHLPSIYPSHVGIYTIHTDPMGKVLLLRQSVTSWSCFSPSDGKRLAPAPAMLWCLGAGDRRPKCVFRSNCRTYRWNFLWFHGASTRA